MSESVLLFATVLQSSFTFPLLLHHSTMACKDDVVLGVGGNMSHYPVDGPSLSTSSGPMAEKYIEQNATPHKLSDASNLPVRKRFCQHFVLDITEYIDGCDDNHDSVCVFCNMAFSRIWNSKSGCICQFCKAIQPR